MLAAVSAVHNSLIRQVNHWLQAASRLSDLDRQASGTAWQGIDHNIAISLRQSLQQSINEVVALGTTLKKQLQSSDDLQSLRSMPRNGRRGTDRMR